MRFCRKIFLLLLCLSPIFGQALDEAKAKQLVDQQKAHLTEEIKTQLKPLESASKEFDAASKEFKAVSKKLETDLTQDRGSITTLLIFAGAAAAALLGAQLFIMLNAQSQSVKHIEEAKKILGEQNGIVVKEIADLKAQVTAAIQQASVPTQFVLAPKIVSLLPPQGVLKGGTEVTIVGPNLNWGCRVLFGEQFGEVTDVAAGELRVKAPKHSAGEVDLHVISPSGVFCQAPAKYKYAALSLTSAEQEGASVKLVLKGTGFYEQSEVWVADEKVESEFQSDKLIHATLKEAGDQNGKTVVVRNPGGDVSAPRGVTAA